jgi:spermidine synthase
MMMARFLYSNVVDRLLFVDRMQAVIFTIAIGISGLLGAACAWAVEPVVLDVYDSPYNHLIVLQDSEIVKFKRMENGSIVSAIDRSVPERQVIAYTRYLFATAFFRPSPERVLSLGLGAGAINRLINRLYPDTLLVSVEIDPMILEVAVKHTGFVESRNNRVAIRDARVFLRRDQRKWDWIILDAFVKRSQVPPHLTTLEFYHLVSKRLAENGIMVSNLHSGTRLFDSHVTTLKKAFSQVLFFDVTNAGNVVALCVNYTAPRLQNVFHKLDLNTLPDIKAFGVDFAAIKASVIAPDAPRLNRPAEILIDDFAPVEFLDLLESKAESGK